MEPSFRLCEMIVLPSLEGILSSRILNSGALPRLSLRIFSFVGFEKDIKCALADVKKSRQGGGDEESRGAMTTREVS